MAAHVYVYAAQAAICPLGNHLIVALLHPGALHGSDQVQCERPACDSLLHLAVLRFSAVLHCRQLDVATVCKCRLSC